MLHICVHSVFRTSSRLNSKQIAIHKFNYTSFGWLSRFFAMPFYLRISCEYVQVQLFDAPKMDQVCYGNTVKWIFATKLCAFTYETLQYWWGKCVQDARHIIYAHCLCVEVVAQLNSVFWKCGVEIGTDGSDTYMEIIVCFEVVVFNIYIYIVQMKFELFFNKKWSSWSWPV